MAETAPVQNRTQPVAPPSPQRAPNATDGVVARHAHGVLDERALADDLKRLSPPEQARAVRALQAVRTITPVERGTLERLLGLPPVSTASIFGVPAPSGLSPDRAAAIDRWLATGPGAAEVAQLVQNGTPAKSQLANDFAEARFQDTVRRAGSLATQPQSLEPPGVPSTGPELRSLLMRTQSTIACHTPAPANDRGYGRDVLGEFLNAQRAANADGDARVRAANDLASGPAMFAATTTANGATPAQAALLASGPGSPAPARLSLQEARYVLQQASARWSTAPDGGVGDIRALEASAAKADPATRQAIAAQLMATASAGLKAGKLDRATLQAADSARALAIHDPSIGVEWEAEVSAMAGSLIATARQDPDEFALRMTNLARPGASPTRDAIAQDVFGAMQQADYQNPTTWGGLSGGGLNRTTALAVGRALASRGDGTIDPAAKNAAANRFADFMDGSPGTAGAHLPEQAQALIGDQSVLARARLWAADRVMESDASATDMGQLIRPGGLGTLGRPWANGALVQRYLDAALPGLSEVGPVETGQLAQMVGRSNVDLTKLLPAIAAQPESQQRDTLIKSIYLGTSAASLVLYGRMPDSVRTNADAAVYHRDTANALGSAMAHALLPEGSPQMAAAERDLGEALNSRTGRALLLSDTGAPGGRPAETRLAAARLAIDHPELFRSVVGDPQYRDNPWENPRLLDAVAAPKFADSASQPGITNQVLPGGRLENFIGASLHAKPSTAAQAMSRDQLVQAGVDGRNLYDSNRSVGGVAAGIRLAQTELGVGDNARISAVPIQFSSQSTGPVDLTLFRVEDAAGNAKFVDNEGRRFNSLAEWRGNNGLPDGVVTAPTDGKVTPGQTPQVSTTGTPASSTGARILATLDNVALVGGTVAGVALLVVGTGGVAGVALVATAAGAGLYSGVRGAEHLYERSQRGQSLSFADPDARAAWIDTAGGALAFAGPAAGAASRIGRLGVEARAGLAVTSGLANSAGQAANLAGIGNSAARLATDWNEMSPEQRTMSAMQLMFSAGMLSAQVRQSPGGLREMVDPRLAIRNALAGSGVTAPHADAVGTTSGVGEIDYAFSKYVGRGVIETETPTLAGDAVAIRRDPATRRLVIDHGPDASAASIQIHREVAGLMAADESLAGSLARLVAKTGEPKPGTAAWNTKYEVEKLSREIGVTAREIDRPGITSEQRAHLEDRLAWLGADQSRHANDLARMNTHPADALVEVESYRRVAHRQDPALATNEVTFRQAPTTPGGPLEIVHGSGLAANSPEVRSYRQIVAELSTGDASLQASANAVGTPTPGTAAARARELVDARQQATTRLSTELATTGSQSGRDAKMTDALAEHLASGREARLLYDAFRLDPRTQTGSLDAAKARLTDLAARGELTPAQINDMARLGWLNRPAVEAARTATNSVMLGRGRTLPPAETTRTFASVADLNVAAARADPFTTYTLNDGSGQPIYSWHTDQLGRTERVTGTVTARDMGRGVLQTQVGNDLGLREGVNRSGAVTGWQETPNGALRATDVGFHLMADPIYGPTNALNVVPGDSTLNNSTWKNAFETAIKRQTALGNRVTVDIRLEYGPNNHTRRPDAFFTDYQVNGGMPTSSGRMPNR